VRILPLGDSITYGSGGAGGYRLVLYQMLTNAGYNVDFTGTQTGNGVAGLPDSDHEGHGGWRLDQIDAIIQSVFGQTADPDIILLLLGTNDYGQNYNTASATNRLEALIARMATNRPNAKIVVANLLERGEPYNTQIQTNFNPFVPEIVARQAALGRQVFFTDLRSSVPLSDMPDNLHPNTTGYAKMAAHWFQNVTNLVSPLGSTNAPNLARVRSIPGMSQVVITFSKPVGDDATNLTHYALGGGISPVNATLDPVSLRDVLLTTTTQTPGNSYTLTVSSVPDRTPAATLSAARETTIFSALPAAIHGVFNNVPEAAGYSLLYSLDIPNTPNFTTGVPYSVDTRSRQGAFTRVGYYLELQVTNGPTQFMWVSMDAFTTNLNHLGVPNATSSAQFQRTVSNLTVYSSVEGVTVGSELTGHLEFWPSNYQASNTLNIPNASHTAYDWGDTMTAGNHGSMQIHNPAASQVLFGFNHWNVGQAADLGIGNRPGSTDADWTFANNSGTYVVKTLQVLVLPVNDTNPPVFLGAQQIDGTNLVLKFDQPLSDDATNVSHYQVSGGVTVQAATLDPMTAMTVRLAVTPLATSTAYQITQQNLIGRSPAQLAVARATTTIFTLAPVRGGVFANVPEAARWTLACSLNLPTSASYSTTNVNYEVDNRAGLGAFSRVAYYLELAPPSGPTNFIWAAMDPFTQDASRIGIPTVTSGALFQQAVSNLTVYSSQAGVMGGANMGSGLIEFWPWNYTQANPTGVTNASGATFDWGDSITLNSGSYGSMQIHSPATRQVLLAINNWGGSGGGNLCVGIGNNTSTVDPDWTHVKNAGNYALKRLQVFVLPVPDTTAPTVLSATLTPDQEHITITFSEPMAETAANPAYYTLDRGVTVLGAVLAANLREVVLTITPWASADTLTLAVSQVRDRASEANQIAPGTTRAVARKALPERLLASVAEAANYQVVYQLTPPISGAYYNRSGTVYDVDNRAYQGPFARVAYYLELATNGGATNWIFVSMDPFTTDVNKIGVPDLISGAVFQQKVTNMNVFSSLPEIVSGTGLAGGNIEFWGHSYDKSNAVSIANASATAYDWGDTMNRNYFGWDGYGSMQIHNSAASQVLLAFNHWSGATATCLGIGNRPGTNDVDWTFADNAAIYTHRRLFVLALPAEDYAPPTLLRVTPSSTRTNLVLTFDEPLARETLIIENFALDKDALIEAVELRPNQREVVLTTTPLQPETSYTLLVNLVADRAQVANYLPDTNLTFTVPAISPAYARVPEAAGYQVLYHLALPTVTPNYNLNGITYNSDLRATIAQPINRVAYYLELAASLGGTTNWIFVSAEPFTTNLARLGVPVLGIGAGVQQKLTNLNVYSSVASIVASNGITTGNIEFWGFNYGNATNSGVPTGSSSLYDWNDTVSVGSGGQYGSMQIHNHRANTTGQVLFAYNHWGAGQSGNTDVGIGNSTNAANSVDYTFAANAANYPVKNLYVLVQPTNLPPVAPLVMAPAVVTHPVGRTAQAGETVQLTATASGTAPFTWQWRLNGTALPGRTNAWLELTGVQPASAGTYDVLVANSSGTATSLVAVVTVEVPGPTELRLGYAIPPRVVAGNLFQVRFSGVPVGVYGIQSATNVFGPWQTFTNGSADGTGFFEFTEPMVPPYPRFYRLVYPADAP
jgi:lysophospholipase L1-like esterase